MIWEQILVLYLYKYCDPHWCHNCHRIEPMRYAVIPARNPPKVQTWCHPQCPRGLRRRSTVARLLRLWVRIPPGAWMFVCCDCCVLSGRGLCNAWMMHPEESYWLWCVVVCDLETSWMRWPWPALGSSNKGGENTGCHRRKGPNFRKVFLRSNYNDITQKTYIQSSMVMEILARGVWNFDSHYSLIDFQIHIETGRNIWFL